MNAMTATMSLRVAPVGVRKTRVVRGTAALRAPGNKMSLSRGRAVAARASAEPRSEEKTFDAGRLALLATVASNPILFGAQEAFAKGGEYGLLEGRTAALVHPAGLAVLWFATVYAGYTGLQWRRVRTIQEEIVELIFGCSVFNFGNKFNITMRLDATEESSAVPWARDRSERPGGQRREALAI